MGGGENGEEKDQGKDKDEQNGCREKWVSQSYSKDIHLLGMLLVEEHEHNVCQSKPIN